MTSHRSSLPPEAPPAIGLIIIGDEILSGKRADKHLPKFIDLLAARGLQLAWADYVGDAPERIAATLQRAFASGDLVFSCGGIGATPDDHTRQCAARALGVDLVLHPEAERLIRERMQDIAREQGAVYAPNHPDNVHRLNMGVFPQGAQVIPNPYNKIPGFFCAPLPDGGSDGHTAGEGGRNAAAAPGRPRQGPAPSRGSAAHAVGERGGIYFLPGFPVMAWPMAEWVLDTHYRRFFHSAAQMEKSVIVMGSMEATLTPLMEQIERCFAGVRVFSLPSVDHPQFGRHIELGVKGRPDDVALAYPALLEGLGAFGLKLGPELVR